MYTERRLSIIRYMNKKQRFTGQNKNSRIRTRFDRTGKLRVETHRRDDDAVRVATSFDLQSNSTKLYIDVPAQNASITFDGHFARTLYTVLSRFYAVRGRIRQDG